MIDAVVARPGIAVVHIVGVVIDVTSLSVAPPSSHRRTCCLADIRPTTAGHDGKLCSNESKSL